jgi:hypothetical protein
MEQNRIDEIMDRLEQLERQNRRMRRIVRLGLIAAFAAASLGATNVHKESLALHDNNGFTRLLLEANDKSASLRVLEPDGRTRIFLGTDKAGKPSFTVHNKDGRVVRSLIE